MRVPRIYLPSGQAALVGCGIRGLQASHPSIDGTKLGCIDAIPSRQARAYLRGWLGYFGISQYYRPIPELDEWLRRRVRMCYWKQWRHTRTKVRHLLALGTGKRAALMTAASSKSYWHLSRSLAMQTGMTTEWLKAQGLVSIRALWMKAQGYA